MGPWLSLPEMGYKWPSFPVWAHRKNPQGRRRGISPLTQKNNPVSPPSPHPRKEALQEVEALSYTHTHPTQTTHTDTQTTHTHTRTHKPHTNTNLPVICHLSCLRPRKRSRQGACGREDSQPSLSSQCSSRLRHESNWAHSPSGSSVCGHVCVAQFRLPRGCQFSASHILHFEGGENLMFAYCSSASGYSLAGLFCASQWPLHSMPLDSHLWGNKHLPAGQGGGRFCLVLRVRLVPSRGSRSQGQTAREPDGRGGNMPGPGVLQGWVRTHLGHEMIIALSKYLTLWSSTDVADETSPNSFPMFTKGPGNSCTFILYGLCKLHSELSRNMITCNGWRVRSLQAGEGQTWPKACDQARRQESPTEAPGLPPTRPPWQLTPPGLPVWTPLSTTHLLCSPLSGMLLCSGHCCCCWQPLDSIVQEKGRMEKDKAWAVHRPNPLHAPSIQEAGPDPPGILQSRQRQNLDFGPRTVYLLHPSLPFSYPTPAQSPLPPNLC